MTAGEGSKLNGSMDLLAKALRRVVTEAVEEGSAPVSTEIKALRTEVHDMEGRLNERIDTTNENVQAQLAQHREDVSEDVRKIVTAVRPE